MLEKMLEIKERERKSKNKKDFLFFSGSKNKKVSLSIGPKLTSNG